jgi:hypothetical protein
MAGYNYSSYVDFVKKALNDETLFSGFKRHPNYVEILEHVSFMQGARYLQYCHQFFSLGDADVESFCHLNDKIGSPTMYQYSPTLTCSPTSIRYIFQSHIILQHIQSLGLKEVSIVEVGCGYGGLFLALQHYAPKMGILIKKYAFVDLDEIEQLQKKYLSLHTLTVPVEFYDSKKFGEDIKETDLFFISNYCFSEISADFQQKYKEHLLPKCSHGFIAWNMIDVYDIGKKIREMDEIPNTGSKNKFLYF